MSMHEQNEIEWRTIMGKMKGDLSVEEERQFQVWYDANPKHRVYFKRLLDMWEKGEYATILIDVEALITDFDRYAKRRVARHKISVYRRLMHMAAVMALFIVLGGVVFFLTGRGTMENVTSLVKLEPGSSRGMLTLADGTIVSLDEIKEGVINENGTLIQSMQGEISYVPGTPLEKGKKENNMMTVPRGGEYSLVLSDGTKVWLNSQSQLRYPVRFEGKERVVELEGEAYFEVARDAGMPFIVKAGGHEVKVYGTCFNVSAYREDGNLVTTLEEGKVGLLAYGEEYFLEPGEQASVVSDTKKVLVRAVNTSIYCSWRGGAFLFEEERLETILTRLSRWYNVDVFYQNESLKDLHFTGDLGRYEDFSDLLSLIEMTTNVYFNVKGQTITVLSK